MPAAPLPTPGALLMGDAFNMRHPLTGGGMTVTLSDIVLPRDLLRPLHNLHDASALSRYLKSFYTLQKDAAMEEMWEALHGSRNTSALIYINEKPDSVNVAGQNAPSQNSIRNYEQYF
ncbi:hypothetical protein V6N12_011215 [Hibiscus sabdariffa]|uniref:Squalene monooxygenase n=1 Tax=Hibiscus sabdariffa TaxID=183260 RepID=A0ABR2EMC7_9ROSI